MKLNDLYRRAIEAGVANDLRGRAEVDRRLAEENEKFKKLKDDELEAYDRDRLFNPFADTRILNGDPATEVRRAIVGIDMEVGEVLLTYVLNRDAGRAIDLVVAHHPEGHALARLSDVMKLQADLLAACGVSMSVAEQLLEKRMNEIERRLLAGNHGRVVDAARLLGLPMVCVHTPADNCVTRYLRDLVERQKPERLEDLVKLLLTLPEYKRSAAAQVPPKIVSGGESNRCGRIYLDMTGGTEGSKEVFEKQAAAGVSTLVGMHFSEEALEKARHANLNVVVAGHIASDTLGLNLLLDEVEKGGPLDIVGASGFARIRRPAA